MIFKHRNLAKLIRTHIINIPCRTLERRKLRKIGVGKLQQLLEEYLQILQMMSKNWKKLRPISKISCLILMLVRKWVVKTTNISRDLTFREG